MSLGQFTHSHWYAVELSFKCTTSDSWRMKEAHKTLSPILKLIRRTTNEQYPGPLLMALHCFWYRSNENNQRCRFSLRYPVPVSDETYAFGYATTVVRPVILQMLHVDLVELEPSESEAVSQSLAKGLIRVAQRRTQMPRLLTSLSDTLCGVLTKPG